MKQQKTNPAWLKLRKFLNDIHLWMGLISGIVVLLVCLSGTIYVFNTEIREMASPELYKVKHEADARRLPVETLIADVADQTGGKVISVKIPANSESSYVLTVKKPEEAKSGDRSRKIGAVEGERSGSEGPKGKDKSKGKEQSAALSRGVQYLVDPYSGKILGSSAEKNRVTEFMQLMFSLHRWLMLDRIEEPLIGDLPNRKLGSYISGTATILFTLGVITGIIIWFPQKVRNWKQGLKVKWSANWKRINHDLHNSLGFYSCILLFLMGITGPQWSFPWYREALRKTLGTYEQEGAVKPKMPKSQLQSENTNTLLIESFITAADRGLNYHGNLTITLPADSTDIVLLSKTRTGFFAPAAADKIYIDQYSAEILKSDIFSLKPFNERVSSSIKAIHVGDVYGTFSKILYFLACLVATSLPITGTLIWINKMKKG